MNKNIIVACRRLKESKRVIKKSHVCKTCSYSRTHRTRKYIKYYFTKKKIKNNMNLKNNIIHTNVLIKKH